MIAMIFNQDDTSIGSEIASKMPERFKRGVLCSYWQRVDKADHPLLSLMRL